MSDMNRPADYVTVTAQTADQDAIVADAGGVLRLMGYSLHETAGATGEAFVVDGATGGGGTEVAHVTFGASDAVVQWFGPDGINMKSQAISVEIVSGTLDITIYFKRD